MASLSLQDRMWTLKSSDSFETRACNCIGPQGAERLCPCMLSAERERLRAHEEELIRLGWTPPKAAKVAG